MCKALWLKVRWLISLTGIKQAEGQADGRTRPIILPFFIYVSFYISSLLYYFKTLSKCTPVFIDCPSSVTITSPAESSFSAGDMLTCESDGYPEPRYTWTDSDGVVVSTASTVTIQNPGPFTLNCTAEGNFTTTCSASSSVSGNATGKIP